MEKILNKIPSEIKLSFLTVFIYLFTTYNLTAPYSLYLIGVSLILFFSIFLFKREKKTLLVYLGCSFVLLIVGISGWFFSPFFGWLYILSIIISFLFNLKTSFFFVVILIFLFSPNIGSVDFTLDLLTIMSLLFIIPLIYFLRLEYLKLKESEKKILILKEENKKFRDILSEVLSNKITKFSVQLRQPLNDIRQIIYYQRKKVIVSDKEKEEMMNKILSLSEESLKLLKKFEEKTTGVKLVK